MKSNIFLLIFIIQAGILSGCSSVTPQTVELSATTAERLSTLRDVHIETTNQYFDEQVKRASEFVEKKWTPLFLRNMLGLSSVLDDLENASSISGSVRSEINEAIKIYLSDPSESDDFVDQLSNKLNPMRKNERKDIDSVVDMFIPNDKKEAAASHVMALLGSDEAGQIMIEFASDANNQINLFRQSLIEPIEEQRTIELGLINQSYGDIIQAQAIITARLEAEMKKDNATNALFDGLFGKDRAEELREKTRELTHNSYDLLKDLPQYDQDKGIDAWTKEIQEHFKQQIASKLNGN